MPKWYADGLARVEKEAADLSAKEMEQARALAKAQDVAGATALLEPLASNAEALMLLGKF